jgi:hypothetical protein
MIVVLWLNAGEFTPEQADGLKALLQTAGYEESKIHIIHINTGLPNHSVSAVEVITRTIKDNGGDVLVGTFPPHIAARLVRTENMCPVFLPVTKSDGSTHSHWERVI